MMRTFALLSVATTAGLISFSPVASPISALGNDVAVVSVPATSVVTLKITGMTCGGCAIATRKVLTRLDGVSKADVSYEKGNAVVTYDPAKTSAEKMIAAIKTLGYTAVVAS